MTANVKNAPILLMVASVLILTSVGVASTTTAENGSDGNHAEHDHADMRGFLMELIKPMGIATLSLLVITVALGVLRRRWNPKLMFKMHKICGISALVAGVIHASLIIFLH